MIKGQKYIKFELLESTNFKHQIYMYLEYIALKVLMCF